MANRLKKYWLHNGLSTSEHSTDSLADASSQFIFVSCGVAIPFLGLGLVHAFHLDANPVEVSVYVLFVALVTGLFVRAVFRKSFRSSLRSYLIYSLLVGTAGLYYNIWTSGPMLPGLLGTICCFVFVSTLIRSKTEGLFSLAYFFVMTAVSAGIHPEDTFLKYYVPAALSCLIFLSLSLYSRLTRERIYSERSRVFASSVQLWNSVLDNVSVNLTLTDPEGVIVEIGRTHGGFDKNKVIGTSFRNYIPGDQQDRFDKALLQARDTKGAAVYEVTVPTPSHRPMTFTTSVWPIIERNEILGFMFFTLDVSDQIEANRKAQHMSQVSILGQLSAGIAHEIRNPLTVITGNLDLLQSHLVKGATPADMNVRVEKIRSMSERIGEIVRNVSRLYHSGDSEPVVNENVGELLADALSFSQQKCRERNIQIEVIHDDPTLEIACKALLISQAIVNLIYNSIDAAKEYKEKWIKVVVSDLGRDVKISVIDSGKGLPQSVLENIGMPFYTTKGAGKGTGLGINLAKKIVEDHGGEFRYDTTSSNTKFDMILPKQASTAPAACVS